MVWKARCDMIFKGTHANLGGIMNRALEYEKRYGRGGKDKMGKFFLSFDHSLYSRLILFTDAA